MKWYLIFEVKVHDTVIRWQSRSTCAHLLQRTPKLQLAAEHSSTGESWIPPKKGTPHPRAKEKPQQDSRRGKTAF